MGKRRRARDRYDAVGEFQRRASWSSYTNGWSASGRGFYWPFRNGQFWVVMRAAFLSMFLIAAAVGAVVVLVYLIGQALHSLP